MEQSDGSPLAEPAEQNGGFVEACWDELTALPQGTRWEWLRLHRDDDATAAMLVDVLGIPDTVTEAFLAPETRPQCAMVRDGIYLNLRGMDPSAPLTADTLPSVRVWFETARVVTVTKILPPPLRAVIAAHDEVGTGMTMGDVAVLLVCGLTDGFDPAIQEIDEGLDALEDLEEGIDPAVHRKSLRELRHKIITLSRFMTPQRTAIQRLCQARAPWLDDEHRHCLEETLNKLSRFEETLRACRERTQAISDDMAAHVNEKTNHILYIVALVSTIFLPLTLITGIMGMNVGGLPGAQEMYAFSAVMVVMVSIAVAIIVWFRFRHWI